MADASPAALAIAVPALIGVGVHAATGVTLAAAGGGAPRVRAYLAFLALATVWLATLAAQALGSGAAVEVAWQIGRFAAAALPVAFLGFGLVTLGAWTSARRRAAVALGLVGAAFATGVEPWARYAPNGPWPLAWLPGLWHGVLWTAGAVCVARVPSAVFAGPGVSADDAARLTRARRRVRLTLATLVALVGLTVMRDRGLTGLAAVPVAATAAQFLVLVGTLRFQLYGVARRAERAGAARTGALARDAAELERLALLGELGATVAHEVRNPLTGIRSLAQRLAGDEPLAPERRARFAGLIVGEVDRLDRFVGSLLAVARRGPETPHATSEGATDAVALFDDLEALVAARAARAGVRLAFDAGTRVVHAPRGPLAQLLLNLVLNAVTHSPADGVVRVSVRADAAGAHFEVCDAGPGLSPDAAESLFAPFAPGARGTGLGLAIVRRVADAHGWRVAGETAREGGARFTLTVPAAG